MHQRNPREHGAVSIFIVIFTALLVTVVTASFIQLMLRNQEQATNTDLAQSAYDSALAGVEDAKRALVRLEQCYADGSTSCEDAIEAALNSDSCESLGQGGAGVTTFVDGEVQVGGTELNQAYSCVKVQLDTESVEDDLMADNDTHVVPLRSESSFNQVRLSWFTAADLAAGAQPTFDVPPSDLTPATNWPATQPSVVRAQLIQFEAGNLRLSDFDDKNTPNAKTRFLYPSETPAGVTSTNFGSDRRRATTSRNAPVDTRCQANFTTTEYLCSVVMTLPGVPNREAYLQLASYYNDTHYKVELLNNGSPVLFDNVQPIVDATGRASDLFRRVKARVSVTGAGSALQFPDAALSLRGSLCKDFFVTNDEDDYSGDTDGADCDPTN